MASRSLSQGPRTPVRPIPSIDGHPLPVSRKRPHAPWRKSHVIMLVAAAIAMTVVERTMAPRRATFVQAVTR